MALIILTSSPTGPLDNSRTVYGLDTYNNFPDVIRKYLKDNLRALIITADPYNYSANDEMCDFFRNAFEISGYTFDTFDLCDARYPFSKEEIETYDFIILGGGHVPTQMTFFEDINLREKLKDYEGVIMGISAGSMNLADNVYVEPELEGESVPEFPRDIKGLSLTNLNVIPHYQMIKDKYLDGYRLMEDLVYKDSYGRHLITIDDGSFIIIDNDNIEYHGSFNVIEDGYIRKLNK